MICAPADASRAMPRTLGKAGRVVESAPLSGPLAVPSPAGRSGPTKAMPRKLRVLALHGFRTSGDILRTQLERAGLIKEFENLVEWDFLTAPHPAAGPSEVEQFFSGPYYEWWNVTKDALSGKWQYKGIDLTLPLVAQHIKCASEPYDGILAFSQGTILATMLLYLQECSPPSQAASQFRFAVLISGVVMRRECLADVEALKGCDFQQPLETPSLHIVGERDPIKKTSLMLAEVYRRAIVIQHPRGHVVPSLVGLQLSQLRQFVESHALTSTL